MHNATTENNEILTINCCSNLHEVLEIVHRREDCRSAIIWLKYSWMSVRAIWCSDNLTVQMKLPKEGANKCWNMLEYQLNSVTWRMRSGALNFGLRDTDNRMTCLTVFGFQKNTCI